MEHRFLLIGYGLLSLPLIIASQMNQHYGESYHLTVCCTHLTGRHARNTNCCLDQESDPWGICSAVCQVERLNLRAPLRNTTLTGTVPVGDNDYQVLNLTVVTAIRFINISMEMKWVARPGGTCTQRDLCEFNLCVKSDPDNATKCIADLISVIQLQTEHREHEAKEPEMTESMVTEGARSVNFQEVNLSTTELPSVLTSPPLLSTPVKSFTISEPNNTAEVLKFLENKELVSSGQISFERRPSTTTTSSSTATLYPITSNQDAGLSGDGLRSSEYSVNFVVGTACGLMGGAMLTTVIIFLCWIKTGNRYPKLNLKVQREIVQKNKIQPIANPFYSLSVPDIIDMVSDSQHSSEPVYAQIGPVDTLSSHDTLTSHYTNSECNTEVTTGDADVNADSYSALNNTPSTCNTEVTGNADVIADSYNTLSYTPSTRCETKNADVDVGSYNTLDYTPSTRCETKNADVDVGSYNTLDYTPRTRCETKNADVDVGSYNTLSYTPITLPFDTYNRLDVFLKDCDISLEDCEGLSPGYDTIYGEGVQYTNAELSQDDDDCYCAVNAEHKAASQNDCSSRKAMSIDTQPPGSTNRNVSIVTKPFDNSNRIPIVKHTSEDTIMDKSIVSQPPDWSVHSSHVSSLCDVTQLLSRRSGSMNVNHSGQKPMDYVNVNHFQPDTYASVSEKNTHKDHTQNMDIQNMDTQNTDTPNMDTQSRDLEQTHVCSDSVSDSQSHRAAESCYDTTREDNSVCTSNTVLYFVLERIDQIDV